MSRRAHLVGAWPGRNPDHAMETALTQVGPYLDRITDGETGDRDIWVTASLDMLRSNPDVEIVKDGDWATYERTANWKVKDGHKLDPANIRLPYVYAFERSYPSFKNLRERFELPDLRFQVGIPAPIDFTIYAFQSAAFQDPSLIEAVTEAAVREITKIVERADDPADIVFQIETVVALVALAQETDPGKQQGMLEQFTEGMLRVVAGAPEGTHWGFHLCLGDYNHTAYGKMTDARALVDLSNKLAADFPAGRTLDFIHVPFAAAKEPPVEGDEFYAPLSGLDIPEQVRFVAGFVHEKLDHAQHRELLARIEGLTGREVDISQACGLARRDTDEEAFEAMREAVALTEET